MTVQKLYYYSKEAIKAARFLIIHSKMILLFVRIKFFSICTAHDIYNYYKLELCRNFLYNIKTNCYDII